MWKYILCLLFLVFCYLTRVSAQNITITVNEESYNCLTGYLAVSYHISIQDEFSSPSLSSFSGLTTGSNSSGSYFSPVSEFDGYYSGPYTAGQPVYIWAEGFNNSAPRKELLFYPVLDVPAQKPVIKTSGIPLCGAVNGVMTANGWGGTFEWNNGGIGQVYTVNEPGTYSVRIKNFCGASPYSDPVVVTNGTAPSAPVISVSPLTALCNGESTTLTAVSTGGTIQWSNGASGNSVSVNSAGAYFATETNGCGTSEPSNTISITSGNKPAKPVLSPGGFPFVCDGNTITLNVIGGANANWYKEGNLIASNAPSQLVSVAGTYTAVVSNQCGTSDVSDPVVLSTGVTPSSPTIVNSGGTLLCNGDEVILSASPSSGGTIRWSTGDWGNSITVTEPGTYFAYEVNACGASGFSNSIEITAGTIPVAPVISPAGPLNLCNGNSAILSITGGGNASWYRDGVLLSSAVSLVVNTAGSYTATSNNACGVSSVSAVVVVAAGGVPAAPVVSSSEGLLVCNGNPLTISASSSGGTIHWSNGSVGNSISVSSAGIYYAYESNGCGNSANSNSISITSGVTPPAPVLNVSGSITLCDGAGQVLSTSPSAGGIIRWSYGLSGNSITIYDPGLYYAYETNGCGNGPSSPSVGFNTLSKPVAPTITPPGSVLLCNGQSASFNASGSNITWSNGVTGNNMVTGIAGTYYAYARNFCGNSPVSNSVVISTGNCPVPSPGTSFFICPGALKTLDAGAGYDTYLWSNGSTSRTIAVGPGNYAVTVSKEGCFATSVMVTVAYYTVTVPLINASGSTVICSGNSVTLSSSTGATYVWSTGATGNSIVVSTPGSYYVTVTDANGCQASSAPVSVSVNPLPSATIAGTASVCQSSGSPLVIFSGSGGTAPYTFSYRLNGGSVQTISTTSGNSVSLSVPTNATGTFDYTLTGVKESSGTACTNFVSGSATITVNPLPAATITGTTAVCQNSSSPLIVFTGSNATAPYTFTYSVNGGAAQTISTVSGNAVSLAVPTAVSGTYAYALLGVQESGSSTGCVSTAAGSATVVVNPLPVATISGNAIVCQNASKPSIVFTGSGGVAPYTFTYAINGGTAQTVSTVSGNSVSILVPTNVSGEFVYSLLTVAESSSTACSNAVAGSVTVVVNPQPEAAILRSPNTHLCNGESGQITVYNWVEGNTYTWYKDGLLFTTSTAQSIAITQAGSYTVMVTSNLGCDAASISNTVIITVGSVPVPVITGYLKVCEGGKTNLLVSPSDKRQLYELYRWTDTPIGDSVGNEKSFSAAAGQYRVSVFREGCYDSAVVVVTADDTEYPAGKLILSPSIVNYGGQVNLEADVIRAVNYQWDFGNGFKSSSSSGLMFQNYYTRADSVRVSVTGVSLRNCKTEFSAWVKIKHTDSVVVADHSFAGNLKDWNLFPVPFHNELKLSVILIKNETVKLDLFTADGSWVRSWQFSGKRGENLFHLDKVSDLPTGVVYFVTGYYNNEKHFDKILKY
jgi:hypothetical protein